MKYSELAKVYEELETNNSSLKKTEILANFLKGKDSELLDKLVILAMGKPFPEWSDLDLGIATQLIVDAIAKVGGVSKVKIKDKWREKGDLGLVAEDVLANKKQRTLFSKSLDIEEVHKNFEKIALSSGLKSQERKLAYLSELLTSAKPSEVKYLVRTILQTLRIGVGNGVVRDAIVQAFDVEKDLVERAHEVTNDFSKVAVIAKEKGNTGLKHVKMELFKPVRSMDAQKVKDIEEGFKRIQNESGFLVVEHKLDGMRCQIHKSKDKVIIFTRRLENVTRQFPEIVNFVRDHVCAEKCIIDSELTAYDPQTGYRLPFQKLSKRIKRKYNIRMMVREIPVFINAFDLLFLNGENLITKPYKTRWSNLTEIIKEKEKELVLVTHLETNKPKNVEKFYKRSLALKNEGIMFKNLDSEYKPGSRVGHMVKLKPVMETLDLVVVEAEWGEGRRSNWLSSFKLACHDEVGALVTVGKMATGLTEVQFSEITEKLKPLFLEETGREVKLKPEIVLEVEYEEIQKSPTYESGFALRFPRLVQFRDDLSIEEIDDINKLKNLYDTQKQHTSRAVKKRI